MANKFTNNHSKQSEQPKFADKNPKNPNARETIVQNPDWKQVKDDSYDRADKTSKEVAERQANYGKDSKLKQSVAKIGGDTKTQPPSRERAPTQDR